HQHETMRWTRLLPPVLVAPAGTVPVVPVSVPLDLQARTLDWTLTLEDGATRTGGAALADLETLEQGAAEDRAYRRVALPLPELPLGYHSASIALDTGMNGEMHLIVSPPHCYEPPAIQQGRRLWGVAVQLYALRSPDNWGMGDFRDLRELIRLAAPLGCS